MRHDSEQLQRTRHVSVRLVLRDYVFWPNAQWHRCRVVKSVVDAAGEFA